MWPVEFRYWFIIINSTISSCQKALCCMAILRNASIVLLDLRVKVALFLCPCCQYNLHVNHFNITCLQIMRISFAPFYVQTYMDTHAHAHTHRRTHRHTHAHMHTQTHRHTHRYTQRQTDTCPPFTQIRTHAHTDIHTHMHTQTHRHTDTHTHTLTHTHVYVYIPSLTVFYLPIQCQDKKQNQ